jgi:D-3-phosphoglycerate dehydrogenase
MRAVFVDANATLRALAESLVAERLPALEIAFGPADVEPDAIPALLDGAAIAWIDHTALPNDVAARCAGLTDVVFLGTGARSYMDPEALAGLGIAVHLIKGYGDTAVAEHTIALLFACRARRRGDGPRDARRDLAEKGWRPARRQDARTRRPRRNCGRGRADRARHRHARDRVEPDAAPHRRRRARAIERLLAESEAVSLHLLLNDETRGFLSRERIAAMRPGAILVNTARGALVDEDAMAEALRSGKLGHAALDVFAVEPLPAGHVLTTLANVTLSAHSAFRTPEANVRLIEAAVEHSARIVGRSA